MAEWATILFTKDPAILKVCRDISARDPSFRFEADEGITVFSPSKTIAYKRGMWFYHKFGVHFQVLLRVRA
jgi:hypothetical protein